MAVGGGTGLFASGGNGYGGGAYVASGGSAQFQSTLISANLAIGGSNPFGSHFGGSPGDGIGGGLYVDMSASVSLKNAIVSRNIATTSDANIHGTVTYL